MGVLGFGEVVAFGFGQVRDYAKRRHRKSAKSRGEKCLCVLGLILPFQGVDFCKNCRFFLHFRLVCDIIRVYPIQYIKHNNGLKKLSVCSTSWVYTDSFFVP